LDVSLSLVLDVAGTAVFALSGALLAVRKDLDIVGVIVLSVAAGLGGGIIRDALLGATPPAALENELYLLIAAGAGLLGFFFHPRIGRLNAGIRLFDALGLGFFATSGTLLSLDAGLSPVPVLLLGTVSGVGGGVVRDILGAKIPLVLYALAALLGSAACVSIVRLGYSAGVAALVGVSTTFVIRMLALKFDWHAPRPRQ
jgi:uncharacterized membrane protein YeiH